jgi:hypothetical protein
MSPSASQVNVAPAPTPVSNSSASSLPLLPSDVTQLFATSGSGKSFAPAALGIAKLNAMLPDGGTYTESIVLVAPLAADASGPDWSTATPSADAPPSAAQAPQGASFAQLPTALGKTGTMSQWGKALADAVYRTHVVKLFESKRLRLVSKPGESERDFRIRLGDTNRSTRDSEIAALRQKYAAQLQTLQNQIQRAEMAVQREKDQRTSQGVQAAVSIGATLLGAFLGGGRKTFSQSNISHATTAMRGVERAAGEQGDVNRANESLESLQQRRDALAAEVEQAVNDLTARLEGGQEPLTEKVIRPRKTDIEVVKVALLWMPSDR